jgi:acyl phosphate:glycerol-3-phosphate acyltransferase
VEVLYLEILLAVGAFGLGSLPFSWWIGKLFLGKDIRDFWPDHNPGATNVFRAGGRISGGLSVILDIAKGIPFVFLAQRFELSIVYIYFIGLIAILGHAYSPLLGFKGGKATAVTGGVLLAVPQKDLLIVSLILIFLCFLALESDEWRIVITFFGTLLYTIFTSKGHETILFIAGILIILTIKNRAGLHLWPKYRTGLKIRSG